MQPIQGQQNLRSVQSGNNCAAFHYMPDAARCKRCRQIVKLQLLMKSWFLISMLPPLEVLRNIALVSGWFCRSNPEWNTMG